MAKMLTDAVLAELLKEAWRDGYKSGFEAPGVGNERHEERDFEVLRMPQIIDKAAVK